MRRVLIPALAIGATIGLSFLPYSEKMMLHTKGRLHFWGHLCIFGLLTAATARCVDGRKERAGVLLALILLAIGLEVSQHFVYHSDLEFHDVGADILGILFVEAGRFGVRNWPT